MSHRLILYKYAAKNPLVLRNYYACENIVQEEYLVYDSAIVVLNDNDTMLATFHCRFQSKECEGGEIVAGEYKIVWDNIDSFFILTLQDKRRLPSLRLNVFLCGCFVEDVVLTSESLAPVRCASHIIIPDAQWASFVRATGDQSSTLLTIVAANDTQKFKATNEFFAEI